ncbi:hypothetical protein RHDC4_01175 [Rhodocyclaceae bacterium]|nr:hypothetical protein RHDC4_01175 [Rhodocyclaceae bacterium]
MVADLQDHTQVERFLRNASADELVAQRDRLQSLLDHNTPTDNAMHAEKLVARIAYELRFRMPLAV